MLLNKIYKLKTNSPWEILIILLAALCFSYSLYIAIKYASQIPLDLYSFRQTQTALTTYWFVKDGFSLAYETPVVGPPWSIPFEFPIYQYIVALASQSFGFSLNATGRVVSFTFLALCLIPVRAITKSLKLSDSVFYIFAALLFSSPLYLYWGRTFMIETTAVFFSVAAIKYFVDIVLIRNSIKNSLLFLIFISLAILQKATTGLPLLALLSVVYLFQIIKESNSLKETIFNKKSALALVYFGLPLAIGIIWTLYTDQIKALNGFGSQITSNAMVQLSFGTISPRLSSVFYHGVIWKRIFEVNLSGTLGFAVLLMVFFSNTKNSIKWIVAISASMGLLPLFLFPHLHIVHDYYPTGNVIFIIFAIAVCLGHALNYFFEKKIIIFALTIIMVASNYSIYSTVYSVHVKAEYNKENSREYAVSEILKREISQDKYFVAFGNDWSSAFSYLSERKSLSVSESFKQYEEIAHNPERFIEEAQLGGIVVCPSATSPTINDLVLWSSTNRNWKIGKVQGCYIAIPEAEPMNKISKIPYSECQGSIDTAREVQTEKSTILSINGWTTISGENEIVPEKVYVTLTKENGEPIYYETLKVNRPDVSAYFGKPNNVDSGFSRIINTEPFVGKYNIGIVRLNQGHLEACRFRKKITINGATR